MSNKRLFRHEHPVLLGFLILGVIFLVFWGGITFFIATMTQRQRPELFGGKEAIGVIELYGLITASEDILKDLASMRENEHVKAVVLRIDSPGGAVGASQEIFEEIKRTNRIKPVVASLGSVAASGGFYAAIGAERIIASPGTVTGSIGVIFKFANLEELFAKIGYKSEVVKSGRLKDIGAPDRPLSPMERNMLQGVIDDVHNQFIKAVATQRDLPEEKVRGLADGRIFSGQQAKLAGLIDDFGNFTDATLLAASLAGVKTEENKVPRLIYPKKKEFSLFDFLAGEQSDALTNRLLNRFPGISYEWSPVP